MERRLFAPLSLAERLEFKALLARIHNQAAAQGE
jgi:hypothetical protein